MAEQTKTRRARREVSKAGSTLSSLRDPVLNDLVRLAARICEAPHAVLAVVEQDCIRLLGRFGMRGGSVLRKNGSCDWMLDDKALVVEDLDHDPRDFRKTCPLLRRQPEARFFAGAPARKARGTVLGVLAVLDDRPRRLTPEQLESLEALGRQAGRLIELKAQTLKGKVGADAPSIRPDLDFPSREALDALPLGIVACDSAGRVVRVNEAARKLGPGSAFAEAAGLGLNASLYSDEGLPVPPAETPLLNALQGHTTNTLRLKVRWEDETERVIQVSAAPLRNHAGQITGAIASLEDVTALSQAEAGLRETASHFHQLTDHLRKVFWIQGPDRRLLYVSPSFERLWKIPCEELYRRPEAFLDAVHPDDLGAVEACLSAALEVPQEFMYRLVRSDGTLRWINSRTFPVRDARGTVCGIGGFAQDLTQQKLAEEALRESEERFRTLADNIAQFAWMADPKGKVFWYNRRWHEYTGFSVEEMHEGGREKVLHPDHVEKVWEKYLGCIERGEIWEDTFPLRGKDGRYRWFLSRAVPICDENGKVLRWFGTNTDISELREIERALRENERRLRLILEQVPAIVWTVDTDLRFTSSLGAGLAGVGLSRGQVDGMSVMEVFGARDEQDPAVRAHLRALMGVSTTLEYEWRGRVYHAHIEPLHEEGDVITGAVAVGLDITDRKSAEDALRRYSEGLEERVRERTARLRELEAQRRETEKLAAAGRMAARVAHEINNPLAGIKNAFLLIKDSIPATHRYYEYVPRIQREIDRIARIVRQMYDLYRPEQDMAREFPADQAIHDIVAFLEPYSREKRVSFELDVDPSFGLVTLPEGPFRQIMYNLLQNAVDASPEGEAVRLSAEEEDAKVTFIVSDNGHGIPEEVRPHIFEPFFTTKHGERGSGLGLGLSVCKGLAEGMGGSLGFESGPRGGTVFRLVLPLKSSSEGGIDGAPG